MEKEEPGSYQAKTAVPATARKVIRKIPKKQEVQERREKVQVLRERGEKIADIARLLYVSPRTISGDLKVLANEKPAVEPNGTTNVVRLPELSEGPAPSSIPIYRRRSLFDMLAEIVDGIRYLFDPWRGTSKIIVEKGIRYQLEVHRAKKTVRLRTISGHLFSGDSPQGVFGVQPVEPTVAIPGIELFEETGIDEITEEVGFGEVMQGFREAA